MNKNLKLFIILVVLAVSAWLYTGPIQTLKNKWTSPENFLAKIKIDKLERIEIDGGYEDATLKKEGERWKVDGTKDFYVGESLALSMIENLELAIESDLILVSSNKDKKVDFKTDDSGIKVKLFWKDKEKEFVVGKVTSDFAGSYVSEVDGNETYSVKSKLYNTFYYSPWRDKTIFNSETEKVVKVRFQYPNSEFTVEKIEDEWKGTIPYNFQVDKEKIKEIIDSMTHLTAVKIPEQNFEGTDLDKHLMIVQVTGEGIDNILMIGKDNGEEMHYVKKGDSDNIYLINKEKKDILERTISNLR